jgi:hypothetical protein
MPQAWAGEFAHTILMTLAYLSANIFANQCLCLDRSSAHALVRIVGCLKSAGEGLEYSWCWWT